MLYIVAPFESENVCKGISSRNVEICRRYELPSKMIVSNFDHRYKKHHSKLEILNSLMSFGVDGVVLPIIGYRKNISIMRVISNFNFAVLCFIYLSFKLNRGDKVFLNAIPPELLFFISKIKLFKNIEIIVDVRDIWPDALVKSNKSKFVSIFKCYCNFLYFFSFKAVDKCIYVAPSFLGWIISKNKNVDKRFIPLGFDESRWGNEVSTEVPSVILDNNSINYVYVGYLSQQFDLEPIIRAFNHSKLNLHIIGGGDRLSFYKSISESDNTIFHGMVSPQFISKNLHKFDIGFLPLRHGAASFMPNKLFDYIASGIPIISYGSPDVESLLLKDKIGISTDGSVDDIYKITTSLTANDVEIMSVNIASVKHNFSMRNLYCDLLNFIS